jgi:zinc protease
MLALTLFATLAVAQEAGNPAAPVSWDVPEQGRVVLVEDHRAPLVELRLFFPAGQWSPWFRESGAEDGFDLQLYDPEGALRARVNALAAEVSMGADPYGATFTLRCLKEDLPDALELTQDILLNRDIDPAEIKRTHKNRDIAWQSQEKDPRFVLEQAGARALFAEGDPRRFAVEPPPEMITDSVALAEARDALVRLPGRVVGFAGDLTREEVDELVVGLLPPTEPAPGELAPGYLPLAVEVVEDHSVTLPNLTQVYFGMGRPGLTWGDEDYPAWLLADHVIGGHFYSRLYVALRHEGGETYGVGTTADGGHAPNPYGMWTFTRTENAQVTEDKLRATLATFHADGITAEELEGAKGNLSGRRAFRTQSPGQVLGDWIWESARGLPPGWRASVAERAEALTLEEVNAFIADFYDPAAFGLIKVEPEPEKGKEK